VWALVFSKDISLKCRTNDDRYSSAGVRWAVRWHKAGSFARLAFVCRLVGLANVPDLVRWGRVGKVMQT